MVGTFTFNFISMIIHRNNCKYWIGMDVRDDVSCIFYLQAGLFIILFHHWFLILEKFENGAFFLPRNFPTILIILRGRAGRGGAGSHPLPTVRDWAGRPSLVKTTPERYNFFYDGFEIDRYLRVMIYTI